MSLGLSAGKIAQKNKESKRTQLDDENRFGQKPNFVKKQV